MIETKICENCGNPFERAANYNKKAWSLRRFCSRRCASRKTSGADNPLGRFFSLIEIDPVTRCWNWTGALDEGGYGLFCDGRAHRFSFENCVGDIPEGELVLHRCDNRRCVNPFHLFTGNHQDNTDDMRLKGRGAYVRGEQVGNARLTEAEVIAIRADERLQDEIARDYGIAQTTVSAIKRNANWRHLSSEEEVADGN